MTTDLKRCNESVQSSEDCSHAGGSKEVPPRPSQAGERNGQRKTVETVTPAELVQLAPQLAAYCLVTYPNWTDLGAAADMLRREWEIGGYLWDRAFYALSGPGRVIALAVMASRPKEHYASPGGYFCRMIDRAEKNELNLLRSVMGLRNQVLKAKMN